MSAMVTIRFTTQKIFFSNVNNISLNGDEKFLEKERGFEENLKEHILANGNLTKTASVKDEFDLNARINLNEDLYLNDGCSLPVDIRGLLY